MNETLTLRDLLASLLRRWKLIFTSGLIVALLLGGYRTLAIYASITDDAEQNETQKEYDEELEQHENIVNNAKLSLEKEREDLAALRVYKEKSLFYRINPYHCKKTTLVFGVSLDGSFEQELTAEVMQLRTDHVLNQYAQMVTALDLFTASASTAGIEENYLDELVTVKYPKSSNTLVIGIYETGEMKEGLLADVVYEYIIAKQQAVAASTVPHTLTLLERSVTTGYDRDLAEQQAETDSSYTELLKSTEDLQKTLEKFSSADAGEPLQKDAGTAVKSGVKYAILGLVLGGCAGIVLAFIASVTNDCIMRAENISRRYGIMLLSTIPDGKSNKGLAALANRLEDIPPDMERGEAVLLLRSNLLTLVQHGQKILLLGTQVTEEIRALAADLQDACRTDGLEVLAGGDVCTDVQTITQLKEADAVVLVEKRMVSRNKAIVREIDRVRATDKKIAGCVLL